MSKRTVDFEFEVYTDASFNERSTSDVIIMFCGSPIYWCSRRQKVVAEIYALSAEIKEVAWLARVIKIFNIQPKIKIYSDNIPAIEMIKNNETLKSKYIRIHWLN